MGQVAAVLWIRSLAWELLHATSMTPKKKKKIPKKFCTVRKILNKMEKKQPTKWEKMFANNISYKGLIFRMYRAFIQLYKKNNNPIKARQGI